MEPEEIAVPQSCGLNRTGSRQNQLSELIQDDEYLEQLT
jgi:hypothetical protein